MNTSKLFLLITSILLVYSCNSSVKPYVEVVMEKDTVYTDEINTAKIHLKNYYDKEHMPSFYLITHDNDTALLEGDSETMSGKIEFQYSDPKEVKFFGFVEYPLDGSYDTIEYSLSFTVIEKE